MSAFEELGVMPEIIQALEDMDWLLPTPVQTEAVPLILGGGDIAAAAETGSGKTGAFCIPILQTVFESRRTILSEPAPSSIDGSRQIELSADDRGRQVSVDVSQSAAQCRHPSMWQGVRATQGVACGKWYYSARPDDKGLVRVGWSSIHAALNLGTDRRGFGYGATGMKSHGGKFDGYGEPYTKGDTIHCLVEFYQSGDEHCVRVVFYKNGKDLGVAFDVSVATLGLPNLCLIPVCSLKNAQVSIDFSSHVSVLDEKGFRPIAEASAKDAVPQDHVVAALKELEQKRKPSGSNGFRSENQGDDARTPLALILEPSRELAGQVEEEMNKFGKHLEPDAVRHLLLVGGGKPKQEVARFKAGVDIVTGTLGTIQMHLKNGSLSLDTVRFFVLDEADTFATDNLRDILAIHEKVPSRNRVQTMLFSATLHSPEIRSLSEKIQSFPIWIDLKGKEAVPDTVHHTVVRLDADADIALAKELEGTVRWPLDKVHKIEGDTKNQSKKGKHGSQKTKAARNETLDAADLRSLAMKKLKLAALRKVIDANSMHHAMLFVRTQQDGDNLESFLLQCSDIDAWDVDRQRFRGRRESGPEVEYSCAVLHGGRRQQERRDALAAFKAGEVRFLICTDVAARGIDVAGLPYIVNVTLPDKSENYIHRVGRVGRADHFGLAVSLVSAQKEAVWYHSCGNAKNGVCNRRELVDAGGCVLWYNESKLLGEIEDRLKGKVEELGDDFRRKDSSAAPVLYGARRGEELFTKQTAEHLHELRPAVDELMQLEFDVQESFFSLQDRYPAVESR